MPRYSLTIAIAFIATLYSGMAMAQDWSTSVAKLEADNFLLNNPPPFPCATPEHDMRISGCVIDWLLKQDASIQLPSLTILALGTDAQLTALAARKPPPISVANDWATMQQMREYVAIKSAALFLLGREDEAVVAIKKVYEADPGNMSEDAFSDTLYALIDAGKIDAALQFVKRQPELHAYKSAVFKTAKDIHECRGCFPPDDAITHLAKVLILAGRTKDAENLSMGTDANSCGTDAFALYAYYSKEADTHEKHHIYCTCRATTLRPAPATVKNESLKKVYQKRQIHALQELNCIGPYPDVLQKLEKMEGHKTDHTHATVQQRDNITRQIKERHSAKPIPTAWLPYLKECAYKLSNPKWRGADITYAQCVANAVDITPAAHRDTTIHHKFEDLYPLN